MARRKTHDEFLQDIKELVGEEYKVISTYVSNKTNIEIEHVNCGHKYEVRPDGFIKRGQRCPVCKNKASRTTKTPEAKITKIGKNTKKSLKRIHTATSKADNDMFICDEGHIGIKEKECLTCREVSDLKTAKEILANDFKEFELLSKFESLSDNLYVNHIVCDTKSVTNYSRIIGGVGCNICAPVKEVTTVTVTEAISVTVKEATTASTCQSYIEAKKELVDFIKEVYKGTILLDDKTLLVNKEINIYLPDINLAIIYNNLFDNSENKTSRTAQIDKTTVCEKKLVHLIHIFEDELKNDTKKEIVKSRLINLLQANPKKIYARKCKILPVTHPVQRDFLIENHIQGSVVASIRYGLYFDDELVSLLTIGKLRNTLSGKGDTSTHELLRFANRLNTSVVGGFSKLLKHALKENSDEITGLKSFADRRWTSSFKNVYETNGFVLAHFSSPNYFYHKGEGRESRNKYQKHKLPNKLSIFDIERTEYENMTDNGYQRVFDSGNLVINLKNKYHASPKEKVKEAE